jgi:hypothetical protein
MTLPGLSTRGLLPSEEKRMAKEDREHAMAIVLIAAAFIVCFSIAIGVPHLISMGITSAPVYEAAKVVGIENVEIQERLELGVLGAWYGCESDDYVKYTATGTSASGEAIFFSVCVGAGGSGTIHT